MKKILVTGATGFVGVNFLNKLFKKKNIQINIVVKKNKKNFFIKNKKKINKIYTTKDFFNENYSFYKKITNDIDFVFHLAWFAKPGKYLDSKKNFDCLKGTLNFAEACEENKIKKFVGIGTCFEYDTKDGYLSVKTALKPSSIYAASKAATYFLLSNFFFKNKISFLWCRLFYVYGNGESNKKLISTLHNSLQNNRIVKLTNGNHIRDFINIKDAVVDIMNYSFSKKTGSINICSGKPTSIREIATKIANIYKKKHLLKFGYKKKNLYDPPCIVGTKD